MKYSAWGVVFKGEHCLFVQRSPKTSRPNQWCLPGGGNKQNETPEETCQREVKEEVGLDVKVAECLLQIDGFYFFDCRLCYPEQPIRLQVRECADFIWVKPEQLKSIGEIMELKKMKQLFLKLNQSIQ